MAKTEHNLAGLYDKRHQIDLIADSLIDTANLYHHENVSVNPFLDNLHLLVQEPRCISFLKSSGRKLRPVYFSLRDPDLQPAFRNYWDRQLAISEARASSIQIPGTDYYICAHRIILEGANALQHPQFQSVTPDDFKRVFERLATTNTELGQNVIDCLEACLPSLRLDPPSLPEIDWATESKERREALELFDINSFWRRLRTEIDLALGSASHSRLLKNDSQLQNLFCVVRTATNLRPRRGSLNYTARVLLTTAQSDCVQKIADPSLLEEPLGDESRSIADSVFHSGLIDFSDETTGEGRDLWSRDRGFRDYLRHEAEKKVYPTLSHSHRPHTFYVPIHVSGVAWLGLFTISPKPDNPTAAKWWSHNYGIYRALIPTVAAKLRAGAKRLFLAYVSEILGEHLATPWVASFVRSVNTSWKRLCYVMPFPAIELLTEAVEGAVALALPNSRKVWLKMHDENPHFRRQVKHELLAQSEVLTACEEACERALIALANEEERVRARFLGHRHSIVNLKPGPLIHAALIQDEKQLSGKARMFIADAEKTTEVLFATLDFVMSKMHQPLHGKSIAGILAWLKEHETNGVGHGSLEVDSAADFLPPQNAMEDVFLVFWNLWHNASQRGNFAVHVGQHDGLRRVVFSQNSEWPKHKRQWVDFLNGDDSSPNTEPEKRGLEIVEQSLRHLRWSISVVAAPTVKITIEIPQNRQS